MVKRNGVWILMALFFLTMPATILLYVNHDLPTTANGAPYFMAVPFLLIPVILFLGFGSNVRTYLLNRRLATTGVPMAAVLVEAHPTGNSINRAPVFLLTARLETGETVHFEHIDRFGSLRFPGTPLSLLVDPADHTKAKLA